MTRGFVWLALVAGVPCAAQRVVEDPVVAAREALRRHDRVQLTALRDQAIAAKHPLAMWADYFDLTNRLNEVQQAELDAFYARWPGSYVEDRLRNDWLLELGRRRDWARLRSEFPRFRMNDDREVTCYALLAQFLDGNDVRVAARAAWQAQREPDDGCALLATSLADARVFGADDIWQAARIAVEFNRPRLARSAVTLIGGGPAQSASEWIDNPAAWLARRAGRSIAASGSAGSESVLLALMRLATSDPEAAARLIEDAWATRLTPLQLATAWAHVGKQAGFKLLPQAADWSRKAWLSWDGARFRSPTPDAAQTPANPPWSDDLLAWQVRAALRQPADDLQRWALVQRAIEAMSVAEQREPAWVYWRARAIQGLARPGPEGDGARALARLSFESLAAQAGFYAKLAAEDLGLRIPPPPAPAALSAPEIDSARSRPGLARGLQLISLGLRNEGVREWNYTLRGMGDRELLAAAQWACEREVWDRCINTSERTRIEIDMAQRFPLPYRDAILAQARSAGIDPALLFGLIRQESRFQADARSSVGASGLMQLMPATARMTARWLGVDFRPETVADRDVNLQLGAAYLKRVLDDFGASVPLAAAAYNAGPNRPRRWREGATVEAAAWVEGIPFNETRDYVKKVLSNAVDYAAALGATSPTLKARLGATIGPRPQGAPPPDNNIP